MYKYLLLGAFLLSSLGFAKDYAIVDLQHFQNLSTDNSSAKEQTWLQFGGKSLHNGVDWELAAEGDFRFYLDNSEMSISLSELYSRYKDGSDHYTIGRKRLNWLPNEKFWQLGHIDGVRGFRLLDSKTEGLVGFHFTTKNNLLKTEIFFSYFFIPTLNPGLDIKNGRVSSPMRWVKMPPTKTIVLGVETPITYELERPDMKDVILQKSLGMRVTFESWLGEFSTYAIYKPENNLRINAEAPYDPIDNRVEVLAKPIVNHHVIFGFNMNQMIGFLNLDLGLTYVDPNARLGSDFDSLSGDLDDERKTFTSEFFTVEPNYNRESFMTFSLAFEQKDFGAEVNGIHYFSKHEKGSDDFYSDTVRWVSALGVGGYYSITDELHASGSLRYDLKRKDNLLDIETFWTPREHLRVGLGVEFIKSPKKNSYWSAYRSNDIIYTSVGYEF